MLKVWATYLQPKFSKKKICSPQTFSFFSSMREKGKKGILWDVGPAPSGPKVRWRGQSALSMPGHRCLRKSGAGVGPARRLPGPTPADGIDRARRRQQWGAWRVTVPVCHRPLVPTRRPSVPPLVYTASVHGHASWPLGRNQMREESTTLHPDRPISIF